ncbi:MAG: protein translocase SEC61 complex subunit gamma [Candidatus Woesearchaeota archaeon]|nr:protein translocase SEC61 complex subunit gamma [Candidatus Woesearchaeota archaeon]
MTRFKSWLLEYKRVLRSTKKPNNQEFLTIVKVSGVGILVIGFIGFVISMIKELLF